MLSGIKDVAKKNRVHDSYIGVYRIVYYEETRDACDSCTIHDQWIIYDDGRSIENSYARPSFDEGIIRIIIIEVTGIDDYWDGL